MNPNSLKQALQAAAQRVQAEFNATTIDTLPLEAFGDDASAIRVALKKHRDFLATHCAGIEVLSGLAALVVNFKTSAPGVEIATRDGFDKVQPILDYSVLMGITKVMDELDHVFDRTEFGSTQLRIVASKY